MGVEFFCLHCKESTGSMFLTAEFMIGPHPVPKYNILLYFPLFI
jgi:hypothetical protein